MSADLTPDFRADPLIASLLAAERASLDASGAKVRIERRLELAAVGLAAAPAATLAGGAGAGAGAAATMAGRAAMRALAVKMLASTLLLATGGVIGAGLESRYGHTASMQAPAVTVPARVVEAEAQPPATPIPSAPAEGFAPTVDVSSLPRVAPSAPVMASARPTSVASAGSHRGPTALGEEQRLLDTARAAVARGAYTSAIDSLIEHESRFSEGRLAEERELLYVQALAGTGDVEATKARAHKFEAKFPRSIFLPAVRAAASN